MKKEDMERLWGELSDGTEEIYQRYTKAKTLRDQRAQAQKEQAEKEYEQERNRLNAEAKIRHLNTKATLAGQGLARSGESLHAQLMNDYTHSQAVGEAAGRYADTARELALAQSEADAKSESEMLKEMSNLKQALYGLGLEEQRLAQEDDHFTRDLEQREAQSLRDLEQREKEREQAQRLAREELSQKNDHFTRDLEQREAQSLRDLEQREKEREQAQRLAREELSQKNDHFTRELEQRENQSLRDLEEGQKEREQAQRLAREELAAEENRFLRQLAQEDGQWQDELAWEREKLEEQKRQFGIQEERLNQKDQEQYREEINKLEQELEDKDKIVPETSAQDIYKEILYAAQGRYGEISTTNTREYERKIKAYVKEKLTELINDEELDPAYRKSLAIYGILGGYLSTD